MHRALRSAAKALVAAGALGLVSPVLAQTTHALVNGPATPLVKSETVSESQATVEEMQVELAWLGSQVTFRHALVAHVADNKLEVSGTVPNQGVKEAALKLASRHTSLPVSDLVTINSNIVSPKSGAPTEELTERAKALLADVNYRIIGLKIAAHDDGEVTIRGVVKSMEDKLKVSRKLRQLDGCSAVVNQLLLPAVPRDERQTTIKAKPVSAPDNLDTTQQTISHQSSAPADKNVRRPYVASGAVTINDTSIEKPLAITKPSLVGSVSYSYQGSTSQYPAAQTDKNIRLPYAASGAVTINDASIENKLPPAPVVVTKPAVTATEPPLATKSAVIVTQPPLATKPAVIVTQPPLATKPAVTPVPVPDTDVAKASARSQAAATPLEKIDHASYVASGAVVFDDDLEAPAAPTLPAAPATKSSHAAKLKSQVESVCGKSAKVDVTVKTDNTIHVKVSVKDSKTQTSLADKILQMPEMAMSDIRLEMELAK